MFSIKGDDNAQRLFEFMANPGVTTDVEWEHVKLNDESSGHNVVGTTHGKDFSGVAGALNEKGVMIREANHNHPAGTLYPSDGDVGNAKNIQDKYPHATMNIYIHPNRYIPYDRNSTSGHRFMLK